MAKIAWLIPDLIEGSGGHRTILQQVDLLIKAGHDCVIYSEGNQHFSNSSARKHIQQLFGYNFEKVEIGWGKIHPADLVFATIWYSAKVVRDLPFSCIKAYFVQDFEAYFNLLGDAFLMAENSYRYGLQPITIGRWLTAKLKHDFNVNAAYFDFCADLATYRNLPDIQRQKSVCFTYQPDKPRRCAQIGIEALGIVKDYRPEVRIYLYGSNQKGHIWFDHEHLGLLNLEQCNRLYNQCRVGLCISTSNPSRIPFEMMACGLPVVEIYRENNLYDFSQEAARLCDSTPESIAAGILEVLSDDALADRMEQAGLQFMSERPLEKGFKQFLAAVDHLLEGKTFKDMTLQPMYQHPPVTSAHLNQLPLLDKSIAGPDHPGRLAFLPSPIRYLVRRCYWTVKRFLN